MRGIYDFEDEPECEWSWGKILLIAGIVVVVVYGAGLLIMYLATV
jgi:hypothetical protein